MHRCRQDKVTEPCFCGSGVLIGILPTITGAKVGDRVTVEKAPSRGCFYVRNAASQELLSYKNKASRSYSEHRGNSVSSWTTAWKKSKVQMYVLRQV